MKKVLIWIGKKIKNGIPFFKNKVEQGATKTGVQTVEEQALINAANEKLIEKANKDYQTIATRYLLSKTDTTVAEAMLTRISNPHTIEAANLFEKMMLECPTIKRINKEMMEPIYNLGKNGTFNPENYRYNEKAVGEAFSQKFDLEFKKILKGDFKDVVTNLISKDSVGRVITVDYKRLEAILANKNSEERRPIVHALADVINNYIVTNARSEGTKALQAQNTRNVLPVVEDITSSLYYKNSPSPASFAVDILKQLQAKGLLSTQDMIQQFIVHNNSIKKGQEQAIKQYNNRDIQIQRPRR